MKRGILLAAVALMFSGCSNDSQADNTISQLEGDLSDAQLQLEETESRVDSLETELEERDDQIASLQNELDEKDAELQEAYAQQEETDDASDPDSVGEEVIAADEAPTLWDEADVQLWEYFMDDAAAEEMGWERDVTNWREWEEPVDDTFVSGAGNWESPSKLMLEWLYDDYSMQFLGSDIWEATLRFDFISETEAEGYVLTFGMKDDAVMGRDMKLVMVKEDETWLLDGIEVRERCGRGVTEDGDLCV